jgi:hypothetical protein
MFSLHDTKPKRPSGHLVLSLLASLPTLVAWSCHFILLDSLLREPPDCEVWCSEHGTLDAIALILLLVSTLMTLVVTPFLFAEAGRRSKAAWFAVTSTALQPVLIFGVIPILLRSFRVA